MLSIKELFEIVGDINEEMGFNRPLYFESDGNCMIVKWLGETIWNSENDERYFSEEKDDWEPLKPYLKLKCKRLLESIILNHK